MSSNQILMFAQQAASTLPTQYFSSLRTHSSTYQPIHHFRTTLGAGAVKTCSKGGRLMRSHHRQMTDVCGGHTRTLVPHTILWTGATFCFTITSIASGLQGLYHLAAATRMVAVFKMWDDKVGSVTIIKWWQGCEMLWPLYKSLRYEKYYWCHLGGRRSLWGRL